MEQEQEQRRQEIELKIQQIEAEAYDKIQEKIEEIREQLDEHVPFEIPFTRPGPSGSNLTYIDGASALDLLNYIFGFENWNSYVDTIEDTVTENKNNSLFITYNISIRARIRIVVKIGDKTVTKSDIGSDFKENQKSFGQGYEQASKSAITDGIKRCSRQFGNFLGNCLYKKEYLEQYKKYLSYIKGLQRKGEKKQASEIYPIPDLTNESVLKTIKINKRRERERKKEEEVNLCNDLKNNILIIPDNIQIDKEFQNLKSEELLDEDQDDIEFLANQALKEREKNK